MTRHKRVAMICSLALRALRCENKTTAEARGNERRMISMVEESCRCSTTDKAADTARQTVIMFVILQMQHDRQSCRYSTTDRDYVCDSVSCVCAVCNSVLSAALSVVLHLQLCLSCCVCSFVCRAACSFVCRAVTKNPSAHRYAMERRATSKRLATLT